MALKTDISRKFSASFTSAKSLSSIYKEIIFLEKFGAVKVAKHLIILFLVISFSYLLVDKTNFSDTFNIIVENCFSISLSLLGLLIAGFSIILSIANNDILYCLILSVDKNNVSSYKITLLRCLEPLIYFFILLVVSFIFKNLYLISPVIILPIYINLIIKVAVLSILLYISILALDSLRVFLINMYTILATYARFEIVKRTNINDESMDILISKLEENLNNNFN